MEEEVCKKIFDENINIALMKMMPEDFRSEFLKELKNCSDKMEGGRRKKKVSRRKMRGGDPNFKKRIMIGLYLLLALVLAYLMGTTQTDTLETGLMMLWKGQCTNISEVTLNWLGMANPVCNKYQKIMAIISLALKMDPTAIATLVGGLVTITAGGVATPYLLHRAIDNVSGLIEYRVAQLIGNETEPLQIENNQEIISGAILGAKDLAEQIRNTPGLLNELRALISSGERNELQFNNPEMESTVEEIDAASRNASAVNSQQIDGGSRKSKKIRKLRKLGKSKKNKRNRKTKRKRSSRRNK
jgi:hypothetical protein